MLQLNEGDASLAEEDQASFQAALHEPSWNGEACVCLWVQWRGSMCKGGLLLISSVYKRWYTKHSVHHWRWIDKYFTNKALWKCTELRGAKGYCTVKNKRPSLSLGCLSASMSSRHQSEYCTAQPSSNCTAHTSFGSGSIKNNGKGWHHEFGCARWCSRGELTESG
jgi:hypothetical protein